MLEHNLDRTGSAATFFQRGIDLRRVRDFLDDFADNPFRNQSVENMLIPLMLPPGRLRLETSPTFIG
jgi:hypothetical protein